MRICAAFAPAPCNPVARADLSRALNYTVLGQDAV
jgi:hypothetical protein